MSTKSHGLSDELHAYLVARGTREHPVLARLREETAAHPMAGYQIAPEQGAFMALLVELTGARRCLEVGTFTEMGPADGPPRTRLPEARAPSSAGVNSSAPGLLLAPTM